MSDTKITLQSIKDEYAREKGYKNWKEVLLYNEESLYLDEIALRYARACCIATQEKISEQFGGEPFFINKVKSPSNIVIL